MASRLVRTFLLRDRRAGPWPVTPWLPFQPIEFQGNAGARLAGRWFPAQRPRATVVLVHPDRRYGQHWFVLQGWIDVLHDRGFNVLTFDFPDFGQSRGGGTYYTQDVVAAARLARQRAPHVPVHIVGLSMGAFAAATASAQIDDVHTLVLDAPYPSYNEWLGRRPARIAMEVFDRMFPRLKPLLRADRLIARSRARRILIIGSKADDVTPVHLTRKVAAAAPPDRTTYLELDDVAHLEGFATSQLFRERVIESLEDGSPFNSEAPPHPRRRQNGTRARYGVAVNVRNVLRSR